MIGLIALGIAGLHTRTWEVLSQVEVGPYSLPHTDEVSQENIRRFRRNRAFAANDHNFVAISQKYLPSIERSNWDTFIDTFVSSADHCVTST